MSEEIHRIEEIFAELTLREQHIRYKELLVEIGEVLDGLDGQDFPDLPKAHNMVTILRQLFNEAKEEYEGELTRLENEKERRKQDGRLLD